MPRKRNMKICNYCEEENDSASLRCSCCLKIMEDPIFYPILFGSYLACIPINFLISLYAPMVRAFWLETLYTGTLFFFIAIFSVKIFQKIQNPKRNFFYELANLYASKTDRLIILFGIGCIIYSSFTGFTFVGKTTTAPSSEYLIFNKIRYTVILSLGFLFVLNQLIVFKHHYLNFKSENPLEYLYEN